MTKTQNQFIKIVKNDNENAKYIKINNYINKYDWKR